MPKLIDKVGFPPHWDACVACGSVQIELDIDPDWSTVHCCEKGCGRAYQIPTARIDTLRVCSDCGKAVGHRGDLQGAASGSDDLVCEPCSWLAR